MMVKPIRPLELHYQMIHFLKINYITQIYQRSQEHFHLKMIREYVLRTQIFVIKLVLFYHNKLRLLSTTVLFIQILLP